jgi:hypothetical protein
MIEESFTYGALKGKNVFRPEDFIFNVNNWLTQENELSNDKCRIRQ